MSCKCINVMAIERPMVNTLAYSLLFATTEADAQLRVGEVLHVGRNEMSLLNTCTYTCSWSLNL